MKEVLSERFKQHLMREGDGDPFSFLGMHETDDKKGVFVRVCYPGADKIFVLSADGRKELAVMDKIHPYGLFQATFTGKTFFKYKLRICFLGGRYYEAFDPEYNEDLYPDFTNFIDTYYPDFDDRTQEMFEDALGEAGYGYDAGNPTFDPDDIDWDKVEKLQSWKDFDKLNQLNYLILN